MSSQSYSAAYRRARLHVVKEATRCGHCGCEISDLLPVGHPQKATADHVVPRALLGPDTVSNLVPSCWKCNTSRGKKDTNWRQTSYVEGAEDW